MAVYTKTIRATNGAQFAKQAGEGPQVCGKDVHMAVGKEDEFVYSSTTKFPTDSTVWTGVINIKKAVLQFTNVDKGTHFSRRDNSGYQLRNLTKAFDDNSNDEGDWEESTKAAPLHLPSYGRTKNGVVTATAVGATENMDVTDWVRRIAPKRVKVKGKAGLGEKHHGWWAVRRVTAKQGKPQIVWGSADAASDSDRPALILTYEGGDPKGTVVITGPGSTINTVEGEYLEGSYVPGVEGALLSKLRIEVYERKADNSDWKADESWSNSGADAVSASEQATGDWQVPVSDVLIRGASLRSGTLYGWRARAYSTKGVWSDWTDITSLTLEADAPVFDQKDLKPNADATGATFVEPSSPSLLNVLIGGAFRPSGANLEHGLLSYKVQVRDETTEGDPLWDGAGMHWDSGEVPVPKSMTRPLTSSDPPLLFGSRYGGKSLAAGTYSYRVRVTNTAGEQGAWRYGTFTLTVGEITEPSTADSLTGYARRQPKVRIRIRSIDATTQQIKVNATGGKWKVSYDGPGTAHTTGLLDWNATAGEVEAELEGLPGISDVTVTRSGTSGKYRYTVVFEEPLAQPFIERLKWVKVTGSNALTGGTKTVSIVVKGGRRPGRTIALIDDAAHIGASEYYNSAGEFYFTLPHTHPQISVIEPWQVHYSLELHRGNGWEEVAAGLIHDFDGNEDNVIFYGVDYLGVLDMLIDERFNPEGSPKRAAQLYPPSDPTKDGSYYSNKTITQIVKDQIDRAIYGTDSPVGFFTRGDVATMSETIIIYCTFKQRLSFIAGLLESWKGKGATGKRTRIYWRRTGSSYEFRVDDNPGYDRSNLRFEYGGLVNGFRVVPYGQFGTRVNAIGREITGSKVQYSIVQTPAPSGEDEDYNEDRYGRWPTVNLWQDITDKADLNRRARQFARSLGKVGKQVALALRVDALALKDGWDICDSIPVNIKRGVIDTSLYATTDDGQSYWTVWGWVLQVSPDGHTDLRLSILPKENTAAAAEDITPSEPILSNLNSWQIQPADPTEDDIDGNTTRWTNSQTGETWELDEELGEWNSITSGATALAGAPRLLATGNVVVDDLDTEINPVRNVTTLPTLPSGTYPEDTLVYDALTQAVYKNVADVWTEAEGPQGPQGDPGADGADGAPGADGADGVDGTSYTVWIAYASAADGSTGFSLTWSSGLDYVGFTDPVDATLPQSTDYTDYHWALIKGEAGTPGADGSDGVTYYTWVKYAADEFGTGLNDDPTGLDYIGVSYGNTSATESTDPNDYDWFRIVGIDGADGLEGPKPIFVWDDVALPDGTTEDYNEGDLLYWTVDQKVYVNKPIIGFSKAVDGGDITAGTLYADAIFGGTLSAAITLSGIITAGTLHDPHQTGDRWVTLSEDGLSAYYTDAEGDHLYAHIPTSGEPVYFRGDVDAGTLTVKDSLTVDGEMSISGGSTAVLENGIATPIASPTVSASVPYDTTSIPTYLGSGFCFDDTDGGFWLAADPTQGDYIAHHYDDNGDLVESIHKTGDSYTSSPITVGNTSHISDSAQAKSGSTDSHIATPLTMPRTGRILKVSVYATGYGGTCTVRNGVWDTSGNSLRRSDEYTLPSEAFANGNSNHYDKDLTSPLTVAGGTNLWVGFYRTETAGFQWDRDDGSGKTTKSADGTGADGTGWGTLLSTSKPNVYFTYEYDVDTQVEEAKIIGVATDATYIYALGADGVIHKYDRSTLTHQAEADMSAYILGTKANAGLMYDATDGALYISTATSTSTTAAHLRMVKVSTALAWVATYDAASDAIDGTAKIKAGVRFTDTLNSSTVSWAVAIGGTVRVYSVASTPVLQANREFGSAATCADGITHNGIGFVGWAAATPTRLHKFTDWDWTSSTMTYWWGYAWYGGGDETKAGPGIETTLRRREQVLVTTPDLPGTPVTSVAIYALRAADWGDPGDRWLVALDTNTTRYIDDYAETGTNDQTANSFEDGGVGIIKAVTDDWYLRGDGEGDLGTKVVGGKIEEVVDYTSSGVWTKSNYPGFTYIDVELQGGGGGGGGAANAASNEAAVASGGGGGGFVRKRFTAADLTNVTSATVTVGASANGGAAGNNNGTTGNPTSFADATSGGPYFTTVQANGGAAGTGCGSQGAHNIVGGGTGGTGSGYDVLIPGGDAGNGVCVPGRNAAGTYKVWNTASGDGGGSASTGRARASATDTGGNGTAGSNYGGGGAGGTSQNTAGASAGGNGAQGRARVIVHYGG